MQIIQCDSCGKRYKVKENDNGEATSKYKCNSCFHIIRVVNSNHTRDQDQLQTAEKQLLSQNPVDDSVWSQENAGPIEYNTNALGLDTKSPSGPSLSLRTKFNLTIGAVLTCAMVLIYFWSESRMQQEAKDQGVTVEQYLEEYVKMHPIGHLGEPKDVAYGVLYLASDESKFVTGAELVIDGGRTAK